MLLCVIYYLNIHIWPHVASPVLSHFQGLCKQIENYCLCCYTYDFIPLMNQFFKNEINFNQAARNCLLLDETFYQNIYNLNLLKLYKSGPHPVLCSLNVVLYTSPL